MLAVCYALYVLQAPIWCHLDFGVMKVESFNCLISDTCSVGGIE